MLYEVITSGTLDNAYGIWEAGYSSSESDPRGVEADGNLDGNYPDQSGQSDFTMSNITIRITSYNVCYTKLLRAFRKF